MEDPVDGVRRSMMLFVGLMLFGHWDPQSVIEGVLKVFANCSNGVCYADISGVAGVRV